MATWKCYKLIKTYKNYPLSFFFLFHVSLILLSFYFHYVYFLPRVFSFPSLWFDFTYYWFLLLFLLLTCFASRFLSLILPIYFSFLFLDSKQLTLTRHLFVRSIKFTKQINTHNCRFLSLPNFTHLVIQHKYTSMAKWFISLYMFACVYFNM